MNKASFLRLIFALPIEISEEWQINEYYFDSKSENY
jgi:hypothetical protein